MQRPLLSPDLLIKRESPSKAPHGAADEPTALPMKTPAPKAAVDGVSSGKSTRSTISLRSSSSIEADPPRLGHRSSAPRHEPLARALDPATQLPVIELKLTLARHTPNKGSSSRHSRYGGSSKDLRSGATPSSTRSRTFTSAYHGVSWHRSSQRWAVQIRHGGKRIHVGYFESEREAALAYDDVALRLRGELAVTNFGHQGGEAMDTGKRATPRPVSVLARRVAAAAADAAARSEAQEAAEVMAAMRGGGVTRSAESASPAHSRVTGGSSSPSDRRRPSPTLQMAGTVGGGSPPLRIRAGATPRGTPVHGLEASPVDGATGAARHSIALGKRSARQAGLPVRGASNADVTSYFTKARLTLAQQAWAGAAKSKLGTPQPGILSRSRRR
jgi:hypothetical protein